MNKRAFRHIKIRGRGFTLVELMVTVSILAILLAIGVPAMQGFLEKRMIISQADALASNLKFARSEALKRGQTVAMCITTKADTVAPDCANAGTNWAVGWLVFVDANNNGDFDANEQILKVQQALNTSGSLNGPDNQAISFTANGMALASNGTIRAVPKDTTNNSLKRNVVVSLQGRVQVNKVTK